MPVNFSDLNKIEISKKGWFANTEEGEPLKPLNHLLYANRHERRKAAVLERRHLKIIGADW